MLNSTRRLPLQIAIGALVLYGITLSRGLTMNSLSLTAQVAGWDWVPMVGQPLIWLFTLPLRLFPATWVPPGLNFFSAITAALTLGLLARTVQLLPWERSWENTNRRVSALPVLLACVVCGLEFNFWQEATAASGEMPDLLFLAASLWLLLEYRVWRESRWLDAAVVVWGLGMAENWLMLLALPLFVGGLIWLHGYRFFLHRSTMEKVGAGEGWLQGLFLFRFEFLLRLAGLGLAGFSIYALLPLVNGLAPHSPWNLGQSWHASLKQTKDTVLLLYYQFWLTHRALTLAVAVYFLVPGLSCLARFGDEGTSHKTKEDRFVLWIYRSLRILLLLACLWLAFDPVIGPRQIVQHQFGISPPMLTFDYLNALGAGFLAGNLLLIAQTPLHQRRHSRAKIRWRRLAVPIATGWLFLVIAGLTARNLPAILHLSFYPLQSFGELAVESLPPGRGVMLSDQPQKLAVFQAALSRHRTQADWLAVDTEALPSVAYRARLERRQPIGWLTDESRHNLTPLETRQLLEQIARTNRLFYLHPSYGHFFERFYLEPIGAIYEMKLRGKDPLEIAPSSASQSEANETIWNGVWEKDLAPLAAAVSPKQPGWLDKTIGHLGLSPVPVYQDPLLAEWYSFSLDGWGVALQQQGRWNEARVRLEQALELNTNNFSARISLACNTNHQAGLRLGLGDAGKVAAELGNSQRLSQLMKECGPFDEPIFCYLLGCAYEQINEPLQAVQQFERTRQLAPGTAAPELALVEIYTRLGYAELARPLINHLREAARNLPGNSALNVDLDLLDANAWLAQTNITSARNVLQSVLQQHPDDAQIANRVVAAYLAFGDFTNALQIIGTHLSKSPDDVPSLNLQAAILMQSGNAAAAIPVLDHVLTLTNLPESRLLRAVARLACQDFTAAETDYQELQKSGVAAGPVYYGLAVIAERRHETNQAMNYLRLCLTNTPPGTLLWREAGAGLQRLGPGSGTR